MKNEPQLTALIARGEDIERDIAQALKDPDPKVKTRIHIDEVSAWHQDARAYLQRKSPSLLQQVPALKGVAHHDDVYAAVRRMVAVLTSLVADPVGTKVADFLTPGSFILAAKNAHPAFRYAIVVAGILAIVVIFTRYGVDFATLVFGGITLVVLMVLFLVFSQAAKLAKAKMALPATVLVWAFLAVSIVVPVLLVTSVFANVPLPLKDWVVRRLDPQADASVLRVERAIKGFLAVNYLPVPGETYTDEQLTQYRLVRASQDSNFSYPILAGSFTTFADGLTHRAAMKGGKIVGVVISHSCSSAMEAVCTMRLAEWESLVASAFGSLEERNLDTTIFYGNSAQPVPGTSKARTGYGQPWNVMVYTESPKVAGQARQSIAMVIATSST